VEKTKSNILAMGGSGTGKSTLIKAVFDCGEATTGSFGGGKTQTLIADINKFCDCCGNNRGGCNLMKKRFYTLVAIGCIGLSVLCGCGGSDSNDNLQEEMAAQSEVVEEINNADYEAAWEGMQDMYADVEYANTTEGFNKMNMYRLYYVKQEKYDEAMDEMLAYLESFDFMKILESEDEDDASDQQNVKYVIGQVYDILESVSADKKQEAVELIGQDTLEKYKEGMNS
jgi:hypothetical protein